MTLQRLQSSLVGAIATIALVCPPRFASAAVTMVGTRVIYDAGSHGHSLQFNNPDAGPSVMQVWVDSGNEQSTPETADAPFVVTPPIFRIDPGAGQTVRLVFTGQDLPQDRESVFFLNTLQIPSLSAAHADQNQMLVMVRNRLKVFYRPPGIPGSSQRAAEQLSLRVSGEGRDKHVAASNASGYFVSVANGMLTCGTRSATLRPVMIAPRSEAALQLVGDCPLDATPLRATLRYIDDYGAVRDAEFAVTARSPQ